MNTEEARAQVVAAFYPDTGGYSHVLPRSYKDFIDGLAWVGMGWAASLVAKDTEVAALCQRFVETLLKVGPNARNFAPFQVKDDWKSSSSVAGLWYTEKPQEFAGPAALEYAIRCGAPIKSPFDVRSKAKTLVATAGVFGCLCRWFEFPRQHLDSVWLAHLVLGKKPASGLLWTVEENPLFSFIAGKKCSAAYPVLKRFKNGSEKTEKKVVPLSNAKPSAWVFRRDPFKRYVPEGELNEEAYTPVAQLVGDWLQSTL